MLTHIRIMIFFWFNLHGLYFFYVCSKKGYLLLSTFLAYTFAHYLVVDGDFFLFKLLLQDVAFLSLLFWCRGRARGGGFWWRLVIVALVVVVAFFCCLLLLLFEGELCTWFLIHLTRSRDDRGKTGLLYLTGRRGVVFGRGASYVSPSQTSLLFFLLFRGNCVRRGWC